MWEFLWTEELPRRLFLSLDLSFAEALIAKNRNTYAKRQREQDKKYRADKKREKRLNKKDREPTPEPGSEQEHDQDSLPEQDVA